MLRFCGLFSFLILLASVPAHPMMGDVDATISPLSMDMSTMPSVPDNATPADEHMTTSLRPAEESDTTMTHAPTTAAAPLGSVTEMNTLAPTERSTPLSNISPSIIGMTNLFETSTTTSVMDNKIEETASTVHVTPASEQSTMMPTVDLISTTTNTPMALPATTTMMTTMTTMTTSNQDATETSKPPADTVPSTTVPSIYSVFGFNLPTDFSEPSDVGVPSDFAGPIKIDELVDNVLTMSSNEETTRMVTSTDSKMDGGNKETAPLAEVTEPPKAQETSNELDSGCNSISTSIVLLSLAAVYVIV